MARRPTTADGPRGRRSVGPATDEEWHDPFDDGHPTSDFDPFADEPVPHDPDPFPDEPATHDVDPFDGGSASHRLGVFGDGSGAAGHPDDLDDIGGPAPERRGWFPVSKPRLPADGIRARSQRGAIATTWWSHRFLAAIETPETASRLTRGKSYARTGQVLSLKVGPGEVHAEVQGSRARPYDVTVTLPVYTGAEAERIVAALARQAAFSAALLAGRMPEDIEEAFRPLGLSLLPAMRDLEIECSCPDWGNPCKHAAAVCFLLAERFDEDPFAILLWRGLSREVLLDGLREHRAQRVGTLPPEPEPEPDAELGRFWDAGELPPLPPVADLSADHVLRRLGPAGITVRGVDLAALLVPAYEAMVRGHRPPTDATDGQ
ncbi:SWIM zinc finger family protein [Catellatospora sp. NPDC049609]|uniref:SWIM zinc finger family protein n=1 Tax=Catellatospora sp. NPDC049609 TaxID=3155505 RepID=UPI003442945E